MNAFQVFDTLEGVRARGMISDRWLRPIRTIMAEARPGIFDKLYSQNSQAVRTGEHHTVAVVDEPAPGKAGVTLFRLVAPEQSVLGLPAFDDLSMVIDVTGVHRRATLVLQMMRLTENEVAQGGLRTTFLLDRGFDSTMADDPIWVDLLNRLRRVHAVLGTRVC